MDVDAHALNKSGYKTKPSYKESNNNNSKENNSINNTRTPVTNKENNIIWFHLSYNKSVVTNVTKTFLKLFDRYLTFSKN